MSTDHNKDIAAIFRDGVLIDRAIEAAARKALLRHKQLGQPVPVWRDGKTVFVAPEELEAEWRDASLNK